jgi:hypothetical protein
LLLVHVPGPDALLNVVVPPTHTLAVPVFAPGEGLTVIAKTLKQPVPNV